MLGALTFLPTYLQYVEGDSATVSGVRTLPMVIGLLITSIVSGNVVSKTGKYKIFPIFGSLVMAIGLYLLSRMGPSTSVWLASLYMFVLGLGIGLCMQVLTIVVQNTVDYPTSASRPRASRSSVRSAAPSAPRCSAPSTPTPWRPT